MLSATNQTEINIRDQNSFTDPTDQSILPTSGTQNITSTAFSVETVIQDYGQVRLLEMLKESEFNASCLSTSITEKSQTYMEITPDKLNLLFDKAKSNISNAKIETTYLRWPRSLETKLATLKTRFEHALALGYAKYLQNINLTTENDDDEDFESHLQTALQELKISTPRPQQPPPIDVEEVFFECVDNRPNMKMTKEQIASVRDAQKLTFSEIPCYDFSDNLLEVQEFCDQVLIWYSLIEEHPTVFDKKTTMIQLLSKLGRNGKIAIKSELASWDTPRDFVKWLLGIKHVMLDSDKARQELQNFRQYNMKIKQVLPIGDYFTELLRINNRIKDHDLKEDYFQTAFISGLDRSILKEATQWHQTFRLTNGTLPSNEILLRTVTILFDNRNLGFLQRKTYPPRTNNFLLNRLTNSSPHVDIGDVWDEGYRKLRLRDYPKLKELLTKLGRCHYCKNLGCGGFPNSQLCPLLANKSLSHYSPGKVLKLEAAQPAIVNNVTDDAAGFCTFPNACMQRPVEVLSSPGIDPSPLDLNPPDLSSHLDLGPPDSVTSTEIYKETDESVIVNNVLTDAAGFYTFPDECMQRPIKVSPSLGTDSSHTDLNPSEQTTNTTLRWSPTLETIIEMPATAPKFARVNRILTALPETHQLGELQSAVVDSVSRDLPLESPQSPSLDTDPPPPLNGDTFAISSQVNELKETTHSDLLVDDTPIEKWISAKERCIFRGTINSSIAAEILLDSGADGMVIGYNFAMKHKLPIHKCESRTIEVADSFPLSTDMEVIIDIVINSWKKCKLSLSVLNIDQDIIFGMPFIKSVNIIYSDWIQQRIQFKTRNGNIHNWYGLGHQSHSSNLPRVSMLKFDQFTHQFISNEDVFAVNIRDMYDFQSDNDTLPPGNICRLNVQNESALSTNAKIEETEEFLRKQLPEVAHVLRPYLYSVFSPPPNFSEIPNRNEDMKINLQPDKKIRDHPLRRYSLIEEKIIKEKLDELLERGFIQPSSSPYGANLLFAKKKDGGLRMCIDYRQINNATIPDRNPLPSHADMRDRVRDCPFLSKIDIRDAFHMIRIDAADCYKTAFKTKYGLFEYTVCPFGLTNSPAVFMRLMNRIFSDLIDKGLSYYVDDLLLASKNIASHLKLIQEVFQRLADNKLHVKLTKCEFAVAELEFCGMTLNNKGYSISEPQISAMCDYPVFIPGKVKLKSYIQRFMGSIRWFADFIPDLASLSTPLSELTKDSNTDEWNINHLSIIRILQFHLTTSPTLRYFNPHLPTATHTDASKYAIGGWLGQTHPDGVEYVVSYWSRKMIPAELNYPVHEQEFLALYCFVKKFRLYLHGIEFKSFVDHKAMEHLQTQEYLSPRQVRWITYLQEFMPIITYIDGPSNTFADWLSRRPDFEFFECPECHHRSPVSGGLNSTSRLNVVKSTSIDWNSDFFRSLKDAQTQDNFCNQLLLWKNEGPPAHKRSYFKSFSLHPTTGLWMYRSTTVVVPEGEFQLKLLEHFHDRADHGHFGINKTLFHLSQSAYWPKMAQTVQQYISSCRECQLLTRDSRCGLLHPLAIPDCRFESVNIDFAQLPPSDGYDSVFVIRDRLTKLISLSPATTTYTAADTANQLYTEWYLRGYGSPKEIVSDRDPRFISDVWKHFLETLGITNLMATARHQQTDGGAEVTIKIVKDILKKICNHRQDNWVSKLPLVQFAINNSIHSATGFTPFSLAHGFDAATFPTFSTSTSSTLTSNFKKHSRDLETAFVHLWQHRERMITDYDRTHHIFPTPIAVDSYVLLDRDGITWQPSTEVSQKLLSPYIGPFKVLAYDSTLDNVTLDLPPTMRCHNVFHVSKLKPWKIANEHFPTRSTPTNPSPTLDDEGEEIFEAEQILDTKVVGRWRKRKFLVRWKGYDASHDTWEPVENLSDCQDLLADFLLQYPNADFSLLDAFGARGGVVRND